MPFRRINRPALTMALHSTRPKHFSTTTSFRNAEPQSFMFDNKKPVGAFRGGIFGFLAGAVASGMCVWYYLLGDYRVSNEMLSEDISALQAATQKLQVYITELEAKADQLQKRK